MSTNAPTFDKAMSALALANATRITNAKTLKRLGELNTLDGIDALIELLRDGDEKGPLGVIPIRRLLCAVRGLGDGKADNLLHAACIVSGDRKIRKLTRRQREMMAFHLEHPRTLWPGSRLDQRRRERAAA